MKKMFNTLMSAMILLSIFTACQNPAAPADDPPPTSDSPTPAMTTIIAMGIDYSTASSSPVEGAVITVNGVTLEPTDAAGKTSAELLPGEYQYTALSPSIHYLPASGVLWVHETPDVESFVEFHEYRLRDTGPAGGLIFYVNPNYDPNSQDNNWKFMESAPAGWNPDTNDTDPTMAPWSNISDTGDFYSGIGDGLNNTAAIQAQTGHTASVAEYASSCTVTLDIETVNGSITTGSWFLPSSDELQAMRDELIPYRLGNFTDGQYWASSELSFNSGASYDYAAGVTFSIYGGSNGYRLKTSDAVAYSVRPARRF